MNKKIEGSHTKTMMKWELILIEQKRFRSLWSQFLYTHLVSVYLSKYRSQFISKATLIRRRNQFLSNFLHSLPLELWFFSNTRIPLMSSILTWKSKFLTAFFIQLIILQRRQSCRFRDDRSILSRVWKMSRNLQFLTRQTSGQLN